MNNKITAFEPTNLKLIRAAIDKALAGVAAEFGLQKLELTSMTYDSTKFTSSVKGTVPADPTNPLVMSKYKTASQMLGFSDNIVGETFTSKGESFTVTDVDLKKPKFPVIVTKASDGKSYKMKPSVAMKFNNTAITYSAIPEYAH
jgi:hypothetical protein